MSFCQVKEGQTGRRGAGKQGEQQNSSEEVTKLPTQPIPESVILL